MVQWLEKWEIHNPATLRCQMPSSHSQWCLCVCTQECILTQMCKHNGFEVLHFTFCPHSSYTHPIAIFFFFFECMVLTCLFLTLFIPGLFYLPLHLPFISFPSFLCFSVSIFSFIFFHLFFFSFSSVAPGWWWGCLISLEVLDTNTSSGTHTYTHCPEAWRLLLFDWD